MTVDQNGVSSTPQKIALSNNLEIMRIDCRVLSKATCIIKKNSNILEEINLKTTAGSNNWVVNSRRTYEYYQDYIPTTWDFNENYLVIKAVNKDSELMLAYKREKNQGNKLWWGLSADQYYNVKGKKFTNSVPFVYEDSQEDYVLFTQYQNPDDRIFHPFKFQPCTIVLNNDINENEAPTVQISFQEANNQTKSVPISKIFDKHPPAPAPPKPENNHFLRITFIIAAILIVIIVILLVVNRKKNNADDDDDSGDEEYRKVQATEEGKTITTVSITKPENNIGLGMEYDE